MKGLVMEWREIKNVGDITILQTEFHYFEDSILVHYRFESGNYIDKTQIMYETNENRLYMLFQRLDGNPFSIEILFENVRRMNYFIPFGENDNWSSELNFAKIVKNEKYYYWTRWKDFDPNNKEHLNCNDFILVEAEKVKWRINE